MKVSELFDVFYGTDMELNRLKQVKNGVNFVSRTSKNNGVSAIVKKVDVEPLNAGLITVAGSGSILSSFVQIEPFYSGRDILCLKSKSKMNLQTKLFYCMCLKVNSYRYSYGRQANRTLQDILLPDEIPQYVDDVRLEHTLQFKPIIDKNINLHKNRKWKYFIYDELFNIKKGKRVIIDEVRNDNGKYNFVSSIKDNNGVLCKTNLTPNQSSNVITINYTGSVGETFYQHEPFWALDSVSVLYPKFALNKFIAMFLITLIRKEKYRFSYGRKWNMQRMKKSVIKLPVDSDNNPDWQHMEDYIKSLPYSSNLE